LTLWIGEENDDKKEFLIRNIPIRRQSYIRLRFYEDKGVVKYKENIKESEYEEYDNT
jgi:hypothetical protein